MTCMRIRSRPTLVVDDRGYVYRVEETGFDECLPERGSSGTLLCYVCGSRCRRIAGDPENRLLVAIPALDKSVWEHYARLARGTILEPIAKLGALLAGTPAADKLVWALHAAWSTAEGDEKRVLAALLWPLPCSGETLEALIDILKRLQP